MRNVELHCLIGSIGSKGVLPPAGGLGKSGVVTGEWTRFRTSSSVGQRWVAC